MGQVAQFVSEPNAKRHTEAHLAPLPDLTRQQFVERIAQQTLAFASTKLQLPMVEPRRIRPIGNLKNGLAALQAVSHRRNIDFSHQVARQISRQIGQRCLRDQVATLRFGPGAFEELKWIFVGQAGNKVRLIQIGSHPFGKDLYPVHIAPSQRLMQGGTKNAAGDE